MRDDGWIHRTNDRHNGILKNANDLYKIVENFLSECEDSKDVARNFLRMARDGNLFQGELSPELTTEAIKQGISGFSDALPNILAEYILKTWTRS